MKIFKNLLKENKKKYYKKKIWENFPKKLNLKQNLKKSLKAKLL